MMSQEGYPFPSSIPQFVNPPPPNPNTNHPNPNPSPPPIPPLKRKRNLPGNPDPEAEVIALSPKSLMATNRFMCEICNKGFQRDQNLQLHRRGHNLPWKLRQRAAGVEVRKKVYVCPEKSCVHHDPSRALGDLTGIKKHFSRKHGEKKWKCDKCSKKYAVHSDWKAHSKICGTREYKCDCGTLFSRKDSFITHRAFCDALADESARFGSANASFRNNLAINNGPNISAAATYSPATGIHQFPTGYRPEFLGDEPKPKLPQLPMWLDHQNNLLQPNSQLNPNNNGFFMSSSTSSSSFHGLRELAQTAPMNMFGMSSPPQWINNFPMQAPPEQGLVLKQEEESYRKNSNNSSMSCNNLSYSSHHHHENKQNNPSSSSSSSAHHISATALLQKAAQMGSTRSNNNNNTSAAAAATSAALGSSGGFGLMTSSPSPFMNHHPHHHHHGATEDVVGTDANGEGREEEDDNLNELICDLNASTSQLMAQNGGSTSFRGGEGLLLLPDKMVTISSKNTSEGGGLTRDFLGVGAESHGGGRRRQILQEGMAKYVSMGSDMRRHYSGN